MGGSLRVPVVVQSNSHDVVAGLDGGGDVDRESVVAADVLSDLLAVDVDLRLIERGLELERHALARPGRGNGEVFPVPAVADVELRAHEVGQTERMRQADVVPGRIVEGGRVGAGHVGAFELPGLVEVLDQARPSMPPDDPPEPACPPIAEAPPAPPPAPLPARPPEAAVPPAPAPPAPAPPLADIPPPPDEPPFPVTPPVPGVPAPPPLVPPVFVVPPEPDCPPDPG